MSNLVVMVGNIGSGKSTAVKRFVDGGYVCVSRDQLRYMIGAGNYKFDASTEPYIFMMEDKLIGLLMENCLDIIVDEVGICKEWRRKYIDLCELHGYEGYIVEMPRLKKKTCVDRRMKSPHGKFNRKEWEVVWQKFDSLYEKPEISEGFKEILRLNGTKNDIIKSVEQAIKKW